MHQSGVRIARCQARVVTLPACRRLQLYLASARVVTTVSPLARPCSSASNAAARPFGAQSSTEA
eukprot:NODE_16734_length_980_cov_3.383353.p2 GENE.NODE_16734_length_980_cov_3.383353~~NODE_16734_length_980_cov_3.383353.p2  ORF type:complete len:64 (-),score=5.29 NODE_16734_length_980_cov_3.383353:508-699(-)